MKQQTDCLEARYIIPIANMKKRKFGIKEDLLTVCFLEDITLQGAEGESGETEV